MQTHHELEMKAIAALVAAGYDAFYNFHTSSLARGVSVRVKKREQRIAWIAQSYMRTPADFNYTETPSGFTIHAGSVMDGDSPTDLVNFVSKLLGGSADTRAWVGADIEGFADPEAISVPVNRPPQAQLDATAA
jgi:hypothetical protein